MAQIIPFPRVVRAAVRAKSGGCHVLIFPGVRIERKPADLDPPRRPAAKGRRKASRRGTGT